MSRKKKEDDLDTETSFADMNVDGMRWYDPTKKDGKEPPKVDKKEQRRLMLGAFRAYLPIILILGVTFGILYLLCWLWLR